MADVPRPAQAPVLKADALKFLTTFRSQISSAEVLAAFPGLVRLLGAQANVVHSYAATCIERLLCLKVASAPAPAPHPPSACPRTAPAVQVGATLLGAAPRS